MTDDRPSVARPALAAGLPDTTLEEINRLWTIVRAFSSTAHDVNNAMQVIAGNAELLEARDLDPAVRRRIEVIRAEAARASTTINRLLAYSRERGVAGQVLDLRPFVENAVEMRLASASRRRVVVAFERGDDRPHLARVESQRLQQTILDLLLAAEDLVAGQRGARITVTLEPAPEMVMVCVHASAESSDPGGRLGGAEASTSQLGAPEATVLTDASALWAAAHLAAAQGGSLEMTKVSDGYQLALRVPGA